MDSVGRVLKLGLTVAAWLRVYWRHMGGTPGAQQLSQMDVGFGQQRTRGLLRG